MDGGGNPLALGIFLALLGGSLLSLWRLNRYRPYMFIPGYYRKHVFPASAGFGLIFFSSAILMVLMPEFTLDLGTYVCIGFFIMGVSILLPYLFIPRGESQWRAVPRSVHTFSRLLFFAGVAPFVWAGVVASMEYFDEGGEWSTVAWIITGAVVASLYLWFFHIKGKSEQEIVQSAPARAYVAVGRVKLLFYLLLLGLVITLFILHFVFGVV